MKSPVERARAMLKITILAEKLDGTVTDDALAVALAHNTILHFIEDQVGKDSEVYVAAIAISLAAVQVARGPIPVED